MSFLPDFSDDQARRLHGLGVLPAQIDALCRALVTVWSCTSQGAAHRDVAAILRDTEKLASRLSKRLQGRKDNATAHLSALARIEPIYWKDGRVTHKGPNAATYLCPLLDALASAASEALSKMPKSPMRHRTARPEPVACIADALLTAWPTGARVLWTKLGAEGKGDAPPMAKPFPRKFRPSASPGSTFWRIVGICYEAVGANASPERAIKAYMAQRKKQRERDLAIFSKGVAMATPKGRRTQRQRSSDVPS